MAKYVWPVNSKRITQGFTGTHHAIDIGIPTGTKVAAPTTGKVIYAGWNNQGYGNLVEIRTSDGKTILLAHLSQINAKVGQSVDAGSVIGLSGSTGNSTGPHLHYEVRSGSGYSNPLNLGTNNPPTVQTITGKPGGKPPVNPKTGNIETGTSEVMAQVDAIKTGWVGDLIAAIKSNFTINWGNVIAVIAGVILISIGVLGLVAGEGIRAGLQPAIEPIAEAIKEAK